MKKIILSILAIATFEIANAQDNNNGEGNRIKFGVKAGYSNTNFGGDAEFNAASNFYFGGLVDFTISEKFHVQPELLYSMEGADETELNLDYIRIPIMAKYYVMEGLNLQAGPEIAFVVGGGLVKDQLKSFDFGLGFGAAYEMSFGVFFDARYNLGLANINDTGTDENFTTNSFNVGLGYRF